jgi:hypothetical protein
MDDNLRLDKILEEYDDRENSNKLHYMGFKIDLAIKKIDVLRRYLIKYNSFIYPNFFVNTALDYKMRIIDEKLPKQTRTYYKNKLSNLLNGAKHLVNIITPEDAIYLDLDLIDLKNVLYELEKFYKIDDIDNLNSIEKSINNIN